MNKNVVFGLVFVGVLALFLFQNAGAAVPLHIYQENSLNSPWVDTSYTNIRTFNSAEQAYVGSTAIKVANNPWGAFGARSGPWGIHNNIIASQYSVLSVAIYGGAQGVSLQFRLSNDYGNSFPVYNASAPANAWTVFNIPLTVLDPNGYPINGFSIAERSGQARTFYIDEIRFVPTSPSQDILAPLISITAPASGVTVAAAVSVSATSTDDTGVVGVQFKLDGNNLGVEDTSAPY
ncbi:MAG: Ig-like domain-containing protein, partial [Candidatus Brennerbacteria bacterium]